MQKITLSFSFLALLLCSLSARAGDFHPEVNGTLEQEKFWAEVTFLPGSNVIVTEFRAWFEAPADKVFDVLIDTNSLPSHHANYKDAAALTRATFESVVASAPKDVESLNPLIAGKKVPTAKNRAKGGRWTHYEYLNFDFPWPLSNRWTVQKANVDESGGAAGHYRYTYEMSVGNFQKLTGYWELVPVAGKSGWTEFRGRYESDPGVGLPKFVTKSATKSGLKRDVDDNRRVLASR